MQVHLLVAQLQAAELQRIPFRRRVGGFGIGAARTPGRAWALQRVEADDSDPLDGVVDLLDVF